MLNNWIIFSGILEYNKQNIVFYCISQLVCYIRIINNVFVVLDYEISADKALFIYAFTQNYTQTAIARGDNK